MIEKIKYYKFENEILFSGIKDYFKDFYYICRNERKYLKDVLNARHYSRMLNLGEVCLAEENNGFLLTYGLSERIERKYITFLTKDIETARKLLTVFLFEYGNKTWFIKLKSENPLLRVVRGMGFFQRFSPRGSELLLVRDGVPKRPVYLGDKDKMLDD